MIDVFPQEIKPPNVNFKVANVLEGLPFPDNSFDFVYVRLMLVGMKSDEWEPMWREVYRILKPGGCAQSVEAGMLVSLIQYIYNFFSEAKTTKKKKRKKGTLSTHLINNYIYIYIYIYI